MLSEIDRQILERHPWALTKNGKTMLSRLSELDEKIEEAEKLLASAKTELRKFSDATKGEHFPDGEKTQVLAAKLEEAEFAVSELEADRKYAFSQVNRILVEWPRIEAAPRLHHSATLSLEKTLKQLKQALLCEDFNWAAQLKVERDNLRLAVSSLEKLWTAATGDVMPVPLGTSRVRKKGP